MATSDNTEGLTYTVHVDPDAGMTVARSPALDPALFGGDAVEIINVDPDAAGTGWDPSPFQLASWHALLRDQAAVRATLEHALTASFADRIAGGAVWATFTADTVVLPDNVFDLAARPDRRALLERFRTDPAEIDRVLDAQEVLFTGGRRTAFDVLLHVSDDDAVWIVSFRDGELLALEVEG